MKGVNIDDLKTIELKDDWSDLNGYKLKLVIEYLKVDITEEQKKILRLVFKKFYFLAAEEAKKQG